MNTADRTITQRERDQAREAGMRLITPDNDEWPHDALKALTPSHQPRAL